MTRGRRRFNSVIAVSAVVLLVGGAAIAYVLSRGDSLPVVGRDTWTTTWNVRSTALGKEMPALLFEPPGLGGCATKRVLVLFHGRGADERQWMDGALGDGVGIDVVAHRLIESEAIPPVAIISADIDDSYGVNSLPADDGYDHGPYFTYIADELLMAARDRASGYTSDPVDVHVGGLSMGAYAALNLALAPNSGVSGVAGLSPAFFVAPPSDRAWIYESDGRESLIKLAEDGAADDLSLFVGYGRADYDWIRQATDRLAQTLTERGRDTAPVIVDGGHDLATWRALAEPMLLALYGNAAAAAC